MQSREASILKRRFRGVEAQNETRENQGALDGQETG
jgi:hypothetical protein